MSAHAVYPQPGSSARNINRTEYKSAVPKRRTSLNAGSNRERQSPDFGTSLTQLQDLGFQTTPARTAPLLPTTCCQPCPQIPSFLTHQSTSPSLPSLHLDVPSPKT